MKIEIELSDVEYLRKEIDELKDENRGLIKQLKSFSEEEFNNKVDENTGLLLQNILKTIYKKLGFEPGFAWDSINIGQLKHYLGKDWVNSERLDVELVVHMTTQFKSLLLRMGIKPKDDDNKS